MYTHTYIYIHTYKYIYIYLHHHPSFRSQRIPLEQAHRRIYKHICIQIHPYIYTHIYIYIYIIILLFCRSGQSMVVQSARIACFRGNSILFPSSGGSKPYISDIGALTYANTLQKPTNQKPSRNTYKSYMPTTHTYPTSTQHYITTLPLHTCTTITTYTTLPPLQYNTSYNLRYTVALTLHTCSMSMRLAREAAIC